MIKIKNLSFAVASQPILNGINLEVPKGGLTALIGPNGAGKSTLLNLIARQITIQTGRIEVDGFDLSKTDPNSLAKRMALVSQHVGVASRLRVQELVQFGRWPHAKGRLSDEDHRVVDDALIAFDLIELKDRFLDQLSGGQRQRAFVAMAVAQETDWLLLDEPLNNLDMYHSHALMQVLQKLSREQNKSILVVIHDINQAAAWADHIISMKDGRTVFTGAARDVITPENMDTLYGIRPQIIDVDGQKTVVTARWTDGVSAP